MHWTGAPERVEPLATGSQIKSHSRGTEDRCLHAQKRDWMDTVRCLMARQ
jgi:hypothetical protein